MEQRDFMTRAKQLVVDYFNSHVDDGGCVRHTVLEDLAELEGACEHHRI